MKKILLLVGVMMMVVHVHATISWMGNSSAGAQPEDSQTIHFYVEIFDNSNTYSAEVVINNGGTWQAYPLSFTGTSGNNGTWEADINVMSNASEYYFHGWDGATNVWDSNGGVNYSITVNPTTAFDGNWNTDATWCDGSVPSSESALFVIAHNVTLDNTITIGSLTINSDKTFTASDGSKATRTLTIAGGGTLTNNGTFTASDGTVAFAGAGTVSGTVGFNDVTIAGGVNFGNGSTVNGVLQLNAGGWVNTNAPTYLSGSILRYNTGTDYGIGSEWYANQTAGAGIPFNVDISSSTAVHFSGDQDHTMNGTFTIASGKTFTLSGDFGADLYIKGDLINNGGTFNANSRLVTFNGSSSQEIKGTGSTSLAYVTIANSAGVSINSDELITVANDLTVNESSVLSIEAGKSLTVTGDFSNSGAVTVKSDAIGTGSLIVDGDITNNGTITVERHIKTGSQDLFYQSIASPVSGAAVFADANQFAYYTESTNQWTTYWNDEGHTTVNPSFETTFKLGRGYTLYYSVAADKSFVASGEATTLNNSDLTLNSSSDPALTYAGTSAYKGTNLVGNPFASAIDWDAVSGWTRTYIGNSIYIWNGSAQAYGVYTAGNSGSGTNSVTNIIPAMQGFWVNATAAIPELVIGKATRTHSAQALMKETPLNVLKLRVSGELWSDESLLNLRDDATNAIDEWDASKWFSPSADVPNLYYVVDGQNIVGNSMNNLDDVDYLQIGFTKGTEDYYTFTTEFIESFSGTEFFLEDTKTGDIVNLSDGLSYGFLAEEGDSPIRFKLHINGITGIESPETSIHPVAYVSGDQLFVRNLDSDYTLRITDITGRVLVEEQQSANQTLQLPASMNTGVYVVEMTSENQRFTQKLFVR